MNIDSHTYPIGFSVGLYRPIQSSVLDVLDLGDRRRQASFDWLSERMSRRRSCCMHQISETESERKRAQRLLNNEHIRCNDFLGACCLPFDSLAGQSLVNVCDQTELHFNSCIGRFSQDMSHLGVVGTGMHFGQDAVVGLVLDQRADAIHGLSSMSFHSRDSEQMSIRQQKKVVGKGRDERPLKYRQSSKWLRSVEECASRFPTAHHITHIIDREADHLNFYLQLYRSNGLLKQVSARNDLLIRVKNNHWVIPHQNSPSGMVAVGQGLRLKDDPIEKRYVGQFVVNIHADRRCSVSFTRDADYQYHRKVQWKTKRVARQAIVEVHYFQAKMDASKSLKSKSDMPADMLEQLVEQSNWFDQLLTFVEVREIASYDSATGQCLEDLPTDQLIKWDLMTTRVVHTPQQSMQVVQLYARRFAAIEQLFRLVKRKGFNVEATQQRSVNTIIKTVAMAFKASTLALRLVQIRDQTQGYPIEDFFSVKQIDVLQLCNNRYQGHTAIQQNPYPCDEAAWAAWIIARMGGWKAENKQRPPGPITMQRGLKRFEDFCLAIDMVKNSDTDVSPP